MSRQQDRRSNMKATRCPTPTSQKRHQAITMVSTGSGDGASQIAKKMTSAATCGLSRPEALASSQNTLGCA
eukprot:108072-Karenia_brevis.AAC.1